MMVYNSRTFLVARVKRVELQSLLVRHLLIHVFDRFPRLEAQVGVVGVFQPLLFPLRGVHHSEKSPSQKFGWDADAMPHRSHVAARRGEA